jgi:Plasmid encoded RepA protein
MSSDDENPRQDLFQSALRGRLSLIQRRVLRGQIEIQQQDAAKVLYQHTVLCQTVMPYRDPGPDARLWHRVQGNAHLEIQAGRGLHPEKREFVDVGLPFGPKPRLVLYYLNAEALRSRSPLIEVQDSLTAFVKRIGLDPKGRNMGIVKDQLTRLSAADFRMGYIEGNEATTVKATIIKGFRLWFPKDERQRVLWPSTVQFSQEYFEDLMCHAVPLNEAAVANLSHSAMALDLYTWLAQRLHRVSLTGTQFVPWTALLEQFGQGYGRIRKFREVFRATLRMVHAVYPDAKFEIDGRGMTLFNSRPPIPYRLLPVR